MTVDFNAVMKSHFRVGTGVEVWVCSCEEEVEGDLGEMKREVVIKVKEKKTLLLKSGVLCF